MKKIISLFAIITLIGGTAKAIIVQSVCLKDGTELNGYIQEQNANGELTVHTDNATVCLSSNKASISNEQAYAETNLDKVWIEWAEKNDEFQGVKGSRTLTLGDVMVSGGRNANKVKILESGTTIKYLELTPNTYTIKWKDVAAVRGEKRAKTALSGINRIYQLKLDGQYEGQYAEETDSTLSLYMNNGSVRSFKIDDVVKYTFKPVNPNQDIFEQSPLIDVVVSNRNAETKGIIIEQNYSNDKNADNYILVKQESGAIQSIKVSDITSTRKEENKAYKPKFDIALKEGEVVVNRMETEFVKVTENDDNLILDSLSHKVTIAKGENATVKITIEYKNSKNPAEEIFQLVKATKTTMKKKPVYLFSYKDLVNSEFHATNTETSVNKITKKEYAVGSTGVYVLYDSKKKRAIPVIVK